MKDSEMMDAALERLINDMDDMEGKSAMSHSLEECPDPLNCTQHDEDMKENLVGDKGKPAADLTIVVGDGMMPKLGSREKEGEGESEGLSSDEAEVLKKLLSK